MSYRYAVIGAGRQGVASAYDLARFGDAAGVLLLDVDRGAAEAGAARVNRLARREVASAAMVDASDLAALRAALEGRHAVVSAAPYAFNLGITRAAIDARASLVDMGGNTEVVRQQLAYDVEARAAGIAIVPDCGMGPGLNISLAAHVMDWFDQPDEVLIWDGGLPADPEPPWNYRLTFNIRGLTNEYRGHAWFLRDGKVTPVPCLEEIDLLEFPAPIGRLEGFVTSGGLSTAPWTFEGRLRRLENKTLRYPGHVERLRAFRDLGLLDDAPVTVRGREVVPLEVLETLFEPRVTAAGVRDLCVMRVRGRGRKAGRDTTFTVELIDRFDEATGFTAMERLTGWHASIMAIAAADGRVARGAVAVERAMSGAGVVAECRRRGFAITEREDADDGVPGRAGR